MTLHSLALVGRYQLVTTLIGVLAALAAWPQGAMGVLAGGLIMYGNMRAMAFLLQRLASAAPVKSKLPYLVMLALKFVAVLSVVGALVLVADIEPVAIALGMLTLFLGVGLGVLHITLRGEPVGAL
jgi:hypothetical protein